MSWIEEHPEATLIERVQALARSLIGEATEPSEARREEYGFDGDWTITDEELEVCHAFDDIVMRCECCGWWFDAADIEDGLCEECYDNGQG